MNGEYILSWLYCLNRRKEFAECNKYLPKLCEQGEKDMQCLSTDCAFENCLHVLSASIDFKLTLSILCL